MYHKQKNSLFISVIIISYNSEKFILETLDSIKHQTFKNFELIICDDASIDNTIQLIRNWVLENEQNFLKLSIVEGERNIGIPGNCNRGLKIATGKWIKYLAADDALVKNGLESFVEYINASNDNIEIIHSAMNEYIDIFQEESKLPFNDKSKTEFCSSLITARQQYQMLLRANFVHTPSCLIKRELLTTLGGWDEQMPYEDWPFFLNVTKSGYKIYFNNSPTVNYRRHASSYHGESNQFIFTKFFIEERKVYNKYIRSYLPIWERIFENIEYWRKIAFSTVGLDKRNLIGNLINSPFNYLYFQFKRGTIWLQKRKIREKN